MFLHVIVVVWASKIISLESEVKKEIYECPSYYEARNSGLKIEFCRWDCENGINEPKWKSFKEEKHIRIRFL